MLTPKQLEPHNLRVQVAVDKAVARTLDTNFESVVETPDVSTAMDYFNTTYWSANLGLNYYVGTSTLTGKERLIVFKISDTQKAHDLTHREYAPDSKPSSVETARLSRTPREKAILHKLTQKLHDPYILEVDRPLIPLITNLNASGYKTIDYSCQGGPGHDFNYAMIVLDPKSIKTPQDLTHVAQIVGKHTPVPFHTHKQGRSSRLLTPSGEETGTQITPNAYVLWFEEPIT